MSSNWLGFDPSKVLSTIGKVMRGIGLVFEGLAAVLGLVGWFVPESRPGTLITAVVFAGLGLLDMAFSRVFETRFRRTIEAALSGQFPGHMFAGPGEGGPWVSVGIPGQAAMPNAVDGTGTIEEVTDTGVKLGAMRVLKVSMTVQVPGRPSLVNTAPATVAEATVPMLVRGATVPVKVDPANQQFVLADWDKATP